MEHLEISPGFSFWWMSLISQKLNYSASPHITTAIRLLAFDLWTRDKNVDSITLTSDDKALAECIEAMVFREGNTIFLAIHGL